MSEKSSYMKISCPIGKITRIVKAFYGYSWSGDCHFIEKDCIVDVPNDDLSCLGEGCSVKIIESPIILQECWNLMASYIQIDYECIPGSLIMIFIYLLRKDHMLQLSSIFFSRRIAKHVCCSGE